MIIIKDKSQNSQIFIPRTSVQSAKTDIIDTQYVTYTQMTEYVNRTIGQINEMLTNLIG